MSDTPTPDDTPSTRAEPSADELAVLRQAAREGVQAWKKAVALRREIAFTKAGVTDDALGRMFRKTFDGPDEEVADAWAELRPPAPEPVVAVDEYGYPIEPPGREVELAPGERESSDQRHALAGGGGYLHEPDPDPRDVSDAVGKRVVADGGTEGEALAAAFDVLAEAAQRGDRRVRL